MERQPTIPQPPKNMQQEINIPLSPTHFVFEDHASGQNQMEVYRSLEILFRATLQDVQGNIINNWNEINTWDNRENNYRLNLPEQIIYKRYIGDAEFDVPMAPSSYEGYGINEVVIKRKGDNDDSSDWTDIIGTEVDKEVLDRETAGGPFGSAISGRNLRQANVQEVAAAEATVARIGAVNAQQLTSWHTNIKF